MDKWVGNQDFFLFLPSFVRPVSRAQGLNSFKESGTTVVYSNSYQQVILTGLSWYILRISIIGSSVLKKKQREQWKKGHYGQWAQRAVVVPLE